MRASNSAGFLEVAMRRAAVFVTSLFLLSVVCSAQLEKIMISAGTPEDHQLQVIAGETDAQKQAAMYEDFVQTFSSNPVAVAYGNWQLAQSWQSLGNLDKALAYGDKALASAPTTLDILVSQTNIAQQAKNNGKVMEYSTRGGKLYNTVAQQSKPEGMTDEQWTARVTEARESNKNSYDFLETAAYNAIVDEKDGKVRMTYIERFTPSFPGSHFDEQVTQYALFTLGQLNDSARLYAYGEKALAANPNSLPTMLMLANAYVDDTRPGSVAKAISYSQNVIALAKADAPNAEKSNKLSAGMAHSTLGYAYAKQEKVAAAIPELKAATTLLKGQDDVAYATALYRLGWAYGKTKNIPEARAALEEAIKIPGPLQGPSQELLKQVNSTRTKAK
jgi:tetratricopeptide (TPR) repeat protein